MMKKMKGKKSDCYMTRSHDQWYSNKRYEGLSKKEIALLSRNEISIDSLVYYHMYSDKAINHRLEQLGIKLRAQIYYFMVDQLRSRMQTGIVDANLTPAFMGFLVVMLQRLKCPMTNQTLTFEKNQKGRARMHQASINRCDSDLPLYTQTNILVTTLWENLGQNDTILPDFVRENFYNPEPRINRAARIATAPYPTREALYRFTLKSIRADAKKLGISVTREWAFAE